MWNQTWQALPSILENLPRSRHLQYCNIATYLNHRYLLGFLLLGFLLLVCFFTFTLPIGTWRHCHDGHLNNLNPHQPRISASLSSSVSSLPSPPKAALQGFSSPSPPTSHHVPHSPSLPHIRCHKDFFFWGKLYFVHRPKECCGLPHIHCRKNKLNKKAVGLHCKIEDLKNVVEPPEPNSRTEMFLWRREHMRDTPPESITWRVLMLALNLMLMLVLVLVLMLMLVLVLVLELVLVFW